MKLKHILDPKFLACLDIKDDKMFIKLNKVYKKLEKQMRILELRLKSYEYLHRDSIREYLRNKANKRFNKAIVDGIKIKIENSDEAIHEFNKRTQVNYLDELSKNSGYINMEITKNKQTGMEVLEYVGSLGNSEVTKDYTDEEVNKIVDSYLHNIKFDINGVYHDGKEKWIADGFTFDKEDGTFKLAFIRSAK